MPRGKAVQPVPLKVGPENLCLQQTPLRWELYYSERGSQRDLTTFVSEQEACEYFYRRIEVVLHL